MDVTVKFPFGAADVIQPGDAATITVDVKNTFTIIKFPAGALGGNRTLNLTASQDTMPGSRVKVDVVQNTPARNLSFGSNIVAPALAGVVNDRDAIELVWDGEQFVGGTWEKVVDAV